MKNQKQLSILLIIFLLVFSTGCKENVESKNVESNSSEVQELVDPLPSWNESQSKSAIISYVEDVTNTTSTNFIPITDRIATFDNDGNLLAEQPAYFQLFFAIDRVKVLAANHPEWKDKQPYKAVLENDMKTLMQSGMKGICEIVMASHAGITTDDFDSIVKDWVKNTKHPTKNVGYDELVYQPMLELLQYLRANDFKTYIVSAGGVDFMRAFVTEVYGIPKEQIIGSRIKTEYDYNDGNPVIRRLPELDFIDDKEGKPLNIQKIIGKKPVFASGNSDGDLQMMQWADSNAYKSFQLYVHHTDGEREWAYDRDSHIGRFDKGLDEAMEKSWTVIDMKNDWKVIFPFELE
ncbi:HAD family hydrolase [Yeosuana sp. MJ-SS3]|uniref:HAD family hydrolase n=1 Tax=Gilvirhabdus luticola TaxID=3079858 RepID=A0ABU3U5Q3_9FLAO|nr:HAD family hydrolase [Yeosuana sp. MJ-SS3]MDU8885740.1 HAD family hydrolase [Yeosuana sp. MJ-SS3]